MLSINDIDEINSKSNNLEYKDKNILYLCLYGKETSSFVLNAYPLSEVSKLQKYNYISP